MFRFLLPTLNLSFRWMTESHYNSLPVRWLRNQDEKYACYVQDVERIIISKEKWQVDTSWFL